MHVIRHRMYAHGPVQRRSWNAHNENEKHSKPNPEDLFQSIQKPIISTNFAHLRSFPFWRETLKCYLKMSNNFYFQKISKALGCINQPTICRLSYIPTNNVSLAINSCHINYSKVFAFPQRKESVKLNLSMNLYQRHLLYNIFSRVHTNDENSSKITWANTFVRVNYHVCQCFQSHIIIVANQTCLILGKVFIWIFKWLATVKDARKLHWWFFVTTTDSGGLTHGCWNGAWEWQTLLCKKWEQWTETVSETFLTWR